MFSLLATTDGTTGTDTGPTSTPYVTSTIDPSFGLLRTTISARSLTNCTPKDVFYQDISYSWVDELAGCTSTTGGTSVRVIPEHPYSLPSVISVYIGSMPRGEDDVLLGLSTLAGVRVGGSLSGHGMATTLRGRGPGYLVGSVEVPRGTKSRPTARVHDVTVEKPRQGYGTALINIWKRILRSWDISQWHMEGLTDSGTAWMYALERREMFKVLYYFPAKRKGGAGLGAGSQPARVQPASAILEDVSLPDEDFIRGKRSRSNRLQWLAAGLAA